MKNAASTIVEEENETLSRQVMPGSSTSPSVYNPGTIGDLSPQVSPFKRQGNSTRANVQHKKCKDDNSKYLV